MDPKSNSPEILIVEDSMTQAILLESVLRHENYRTCTVQSGIEALRFLETRKPALILTDIVMPEIDGYELCRRVRANPLTSNVPVILLSALTDPADIVKGLQCGADNFLIKPCEAGVLLPRIRHILATHSPARAEMARNGMEAAMKGGAQLEGPGHLQIVDLLRSSCELASQKTEELRRAHEEAERAREAAERSNAAKTQLLARIGHELRTPLNAILGFAQLLLAQDFDEDNADSVRQILRGGEHLLQLSNEMSEISRIETGNVSISCERIHCRDLLDRCVDLVRPLGYQRGVRIFCDCADDAMPPVYADIQRASEVFLNLLSNAVKYNREGGKVVITPEKRDDGMMRMSVTDTGLGIPAQKLALLFTPFERLGAENSSIEGSGLGLAISKRLAELMGGTIGVQSEEGFGSTFWLDLPIWSEMRDRAATYVTVADLGE